MPSFPLLPSGFVAGGGWRPLKFNPQPPYLKGWDVYDLQCKLTWIGVAGDGIILDKDGIYGPKTKNAVMAFQADFAPTAGPVDGIAGARTQVALGAKSAVHWELPERVRGQMEKESSLLCGIYTPTYQDGSQDTGPLQMNTNYHKNLNENFDVSKAIPVLVKRIKDAHRKYTGWGVRDERAWEAAQGHWNSPVYADRYAKGQQVPESFLAYIAAVTAYA